MICTVETFMPGSDHVGFVQICNAADALNKNGPDPHVITGALIEMSTFTDALPTSRLSNDSRVAPEYNAGFTGAFLRCAPSRQLFQHGLFFVPADPPCCCCDCAFVAKDDLAAMRSVGWRGLPS